MSVDMRKKLLSMKLISDAKVIEVKRIVEDPIHKLHDNCEQECVHHVVDMKESKLP
jgi:hypothetical protein